MTLPSMTEQEWMECADPQKMLTFIQGSTAERKLRLFAVACCRRVWDRLLDERSRRAVEIIERHIEGQTNDAEWQTAAAGAEHAYRYLREQVLASFVGEELACQASQMPRGLFDLTDLQTAIDAHNAADGDAIVLAASSVWTASSLEVDFVDAGYTLFDSAINTANQASDPAPTPHVEKGAQAGMVRDFFGNPFCPVSINRAWLNTTVLSLAQAAYEDRRLPAGTLDNARLAILADALEDTGCDNAAILNHCRQPGVHVRGCWVVNLLLAKR